MNFIPFTSYTVEQLAIRARDTDKEVRKEVYARFKSDIHITERIDGKDVKSVGPAYPTNLPLDVIENLVNIGTQDRDQVVRKAAKDMIRAWVEAVESETFKPEPDTFLPIEAGLVTFLRELGILSMSAETLIVASRIIEAIFETRPALFNGLRILGA